MNRQDLHNRPTRYELIAERGDTRILIGYCMRTGRRSILDACVKHGPALIAFMRIIDEHLLVFLKPAKLGAHIGPAANPWSVRFSGRTQRECCGSELPFIGDWKAAAEGICKHCGSIGIAGQKCEECVPSDGLGRMVYQEVSA